MPKLSPQRRRPSLESPVSFEDIQERAIAFRRLYDAAIRRYALAPDLHVTIHVFWDEQNEGGIRARCGIGGRMMYFDLDEMTPQEIMKCAEIRSMVADWVSGKRTELPPSNVPDPDGSDVFPP